ncbi:MAG: CDP-alcohol phosphatidyltransferase family protein [Caldilineaceae bacterium]|nr:CDP-alcohol phosphatidyltransferase family protein [Caldilineaceae bacterium]
MKDAPLRRYKDRLLQPLVERFLAETSPNHLSVLAVAPGILAAVAVLYEWYWVGLILWLLNRTLDGVDGLAARVHGKTSDWGGYLDLHLDFVVYLLVPVAFVWATPSLANIWALIFLFASFQINTLSWTLLSAIVEKRRQHDTARLTTVEMPTGLIEGAETVIFYSLFFLMPGLVHLLFWIMGMLVFFTAGQRIWWAWRNLR